MSKRTLVPVAALSAVVGFGILAVRVEPGAERRLPEAKAAPAPHAVPVVQGSLSGRVRAPGASPSERGASPSERGASPSERGASPDRAGAASAPVVHGVFYPERATPYFQHRTAEALREALLVGDHGAALRAAESALAFQAPHPERVLFVLAFVLHGQRRFAESAPLFEDLVARYPVLAGVAAFYAARSYYHVSLPGRALALLAKVPADAAEAPRALLLRGDLHRAQGAFGEAAKAYARFLRAHAGRPGTQEARVRLAECLAAERSPGVAARRQAVELLRRVSLEAPGTPWARRAEAQLPAALASVPDARLRARLTRSSCRDELVRAGAWLRAGKLARAALSLRAAQRLGPCPGPALCEVAARLGRKQSRRKASRAASLGTLALARRHCRGAGGAELWVRATYSLARAQAALGRVAAADALLRALEARFPAHSYADDARFQRAELLRRRGRVAAADRLLASLPRRYPKGDMSHAALWRLGWAAYVRNDLQGALALLGKAAALPTAPDRVEAEGRAAYWRARVLARLGRGEEALAAYEAVATGYPLSFYALLACNRLAEASPERARRILEGWRPTSAPAVLRFGPAPLYAKPGFARAVELARLGLGDLAAEALGHLGLRSPVRVLGEAGAAGKDAGDAKVRSAARREALLATAVLYDRAGLPHKSHWIVRHSLRQHESRPPRGADRARWRVGFPEAYASLVRANAQANRLPTALVFGLMREESAFNPRLVSHAKAVGLMQLLVETARRFRAGPAGPITRVSLKLPPRNVPIGTKYLGWLLRLFHGQLVLAVAAYNAGETKVFSWARERGHLPVDHFVEEIPFRETRHYVKRVLGSAFAYAVLEPARAPLLPVPEVFPPSLVVKARGWQRLAAGWARAKRAASRDAKRASARRARREGAPTARRRRARGARPPAARPRAATARPRASAARPRPH